MEKLYAAQLLNKQGYHVAETVLSDGYETYHHTHDFYEIFLMQEGEMIHYCNNIRAIVSKDDLCLVRPEDIHYFRKGNCKNAHFINLAFSKETWEKGIHIWENYLGGELIKLKNQVHLHGNMSQAIASRILYMMRHMVHESDLPAQNLMLSTLIDSLTCLQNEKTSQEVIPGWLEKACHLMYRKENYQLGLEQFVKLSDRSQEHLTRMMKKYYHMTPSGYVNHIRLEQAAFLLRTTEESIISIMLESGFNNVSYFNQRFREEYGQSPSRYRRFNRLPVG